MEQEFGVPASAEFCFIPKQNLAEAGTPNPSEKIALAETEHSGSLAHEKVLIIEDDPAMTIALSYGFESQGFVAEVAKDGKKACGWLRKKPSTS